MNHNLSQMVLRNKRDKQQEYTLHLFEKCNLSCNFCWQDHTAYVGIDTVRQKTSILCEMLDEDPNSDFVINIMGGEIFSDDVFSDKLWGDYFALCWHTHQHVQTLGKKIAFNFVSNLVTNKVEEVLSLLEALRKEGLTATLTTSYDAKGRFNKIQFEKFKENIEKFRSEITCISMLLTKPVIKQLIEGKDDYFKYLYDQGFYIYFDYYSPSDDHLTMGPSDKDLLKAFYFLVDNYPNVHPIKEWITHDTNYMSCRSSKLINPDGTKCMCGNLLVKNKSVVTFFKSKIQKANNDDIEDAFLNRWDCLSCEYFNRCTLGCFVQHDFMKRGQLEECPFKLTFDKITKGKEVNIDSLKQHFGTQEAGRPESREPAHG